MTDVFTRAKRREIMQRVRRAGTAPEVLAAQALRRLGLRFRRHPAHLPGKPDFVFPGVRVALFVHGCFWHGHRGCSKGTKRPDTRPEYWADKIRRNRRRDRRVARELRELGFSVYTLWECRIRRYELPKRLVRRLAKGTPAGKCHTA